MKPKWCFFFLRQPSMLSGLWALATAGIAMSIVISFRAGCAGDTKSMSFGDVTRALQLEEYAFITALMSAALSAVAFCLRSKSSNREIIGFLLACFLFAGLSIASIQAEFQWVQSCFN